MALSRSSIKELEKLLSRFKGGEIGDYEVIERIDKLKLSNTCIYSVEQYVGGIKHGEVATITWMTTLDSDLAEKYRKIAEESNPDLVLYVTMRHNTTEV